MKVIAGKTGRDVGQHGNIWTMSHMDMKKGDVIPMGKHALDHVSLLARGSVLFEVEGEEPVLIHARNYIGVKGGQRHQVTAMEDGTDWTCFHVVLDASKQPDISLDHYQHTLEYV